MNPDFKFTADDIKFQQENALELFYSGIKSEEYKISLERNLKKARGKIIGVSSWKVILPLIILIFLTHWVCVQIQELTNRSWIKEKKITTKLATTNTTGVKTIQCEEYEKSHLIVPDCDFIPLDPCLFRSIFWTIVDF